MWKFVEMNAAVNSESKRRPWGDNDELRLAKQGYKKDSDGIYRQMQQIPNRQQYYNPAVYRDSVTIGENAGSDKVKNTIYVTSCFFIH